MKILTALTIIGALLPLCTNGETPTNRNHENILSRIFAATDDDTIFGNYNGNYELWFIEVPMFFLQLVKLGDDIALPAVSWYSDSFWSVEDHVITNAKLRNITTTKVQASMNGNQLRVALTIGDVDIICPECTLDKETRSMLPPWGSEGKTFYRGFSFFIKNYVVDLTCNVTMGQFGLQLSNLDIAWNIDNFLGRRENSTYTSPGGDVREQGPTEIKWQTRLLDNWRIDKYNALIRFQDLLNCFLSNGRTGHQDCRMYMGEALHRQSIAQIFHGLGLVALNNRRAGEHELNVNAEEDPIRTASRLWFDFGTHILQTGKIAGTLQNDGSQPPFRFPIRKTYSYNYTKAVCDDDNNCEDVHEYIRLGGEFNTTETTVLLGVVENNAEVVFGMSNFSYSFTVPNLTLTSTDYEKISTNLNTGIQNEYRGLVLTVANSMIGVTGDFEFVEGHFQVSNLRLMMDVGEVSMDLPNVVKSEDGSVSEMPPIHEDAAPMVMALWESKDENGVALEERFAAVMETTINDFLAGRSSL